MTTDKPRHDGEWVRVPRTYLRLVHDTLQDIDAYIIVPTFARDDWETAKEQTAALAASPATSALGTEEGEHAADLAAFGASEHACYLYPGVDQQKERAAFCKGAAINATSHTQTIEALRAALKAERVACAKIAEYHREKERDARNSMVGRNEDLFRCHDYGMGAAQTIAAAILARKTEGE